jgi:hypothetical protein
MSIIVELTPADWDILTEEAGAYAIGVPSRAPNPYADSPSNAMIVDVSKMANFIGGQVVMQVKPARMADLPDADYGIRGWMDLQVDVETSRGLMVVAARSTFPGLDGATEFSGIWLVGGFLVIEGPVVFSLLLIDASAFNVGPPRLLIDPVILPVPVAPVRLGLSLKVRDGEVGTVIDVSYNIDGIGWVEVIRDFEDEESSPLIGIQNSALILVGDPVMPAGGIIVLDDFEIGEFAPEPGPRIDRVSPSLGNTQGGTEVSIAGDHFNNTRSVTFYDPVFPSRPSVDAAIVSYSTEELIVIAPPNYPGFVDVRVVTATGEDLFQDFEYRDLGPSSLDLPAVDGFESPSWA